MGTKTSVIGPLNQQVELKALHLGIETGKYFSEFQKTCFFADDIIMKSMLLIMYSDHSKRPLCKQR